MRRIPTSFLFIFSYLFLRAQVSPFIHVDQFGYYPGMEKVAVLSDPQEGFNASESYVPSATLEVKNALNDQTVFSGPITEFNNGETDAASGDRGWWFDFTALETDGSFYVYDPQNDERSAVFEIAPVLFKNVMEEAGRMFFYNRCNFPKSAPFAETNWTDGQNFLHPLQDANCRFIDDPDNATLEKDLSGGWFDAGDYNKYVTFAEGALHDLLWAFEESPNAFFDDWNIPESGNGLPDLLDEIKWELDWLLKMTNADGSVHIKMGSQNFSENTYSPPSANFDQRFYGPTCTSASAAVANIFAHAALIFQNISGQENYAEQLKLNAENAFNYVEPFFNNGTLEENCDDGSIVAGDTDRNETQQIESLIAASVYLFELTGNNNYHQFFQNNYAATSTMTNGFWGADVVVVQDALLRYTQISNGIYFIQNEIAQSATADVNNNWNGYFGWQENDLYRSFMPTWSYYWGSNRPKAAYGSLNHTMADLGFTNDAPGLLRKANEHLHYFHGVNPLGTVMLSNMYEKGGDRCVNEIYHTWFYDGTEYDHALNSPKGPAPGFVTGGPNPTFSYTQLSPPAGQPILKSYLDFNTGWPESSWEISEPAIYYQAAYIRLLANYVSGEPIPTSVFENKKTFQEITAIPNPASDFVSFNLNAGNYGLIVADINGKTIKQLKINGAEQIKIADLMPGIYFVKIIGTQRGEEFFGKIIKE